MAGLDKADIHILDCLQADARMSDADIADKIGVERTKVTKKRLRLQKEKYILRYQAVLDRHKLNLGLLVSTLVSLENHRPETLEGFEKSIEKDFPNVIQWSLVQGSWEYLLTFIVSGMKQYDGLHRQLTELKNVKRTRGLTPQRMQELPKVLPLTLPI